jgi:hypothetical protein
MNIGVLNPPVCAYGARYAAHRLPLPVSAGAAGPGSGPAAPASKQDARRGSWPSPDQESTAGQVRYRQVLGACGREQARPV